MPINIEPTILIQIVTGVATIAGAGGMVRAQLNGTRETIRDIRKDQKEQITKIDGVIERTAHLSERIAIIETMYDTLPCAVHQREIERLKDLKK
jgi:hypothetical protein